ncbi:LysR family transcriptional regulator [Endothiovibrio diazotrophicus]
MNLNPLRFVAAVAELGSFSKAAEQCFVTQPTLSNAVAQLEERLGGRLFHRTTRKVELTPFGRQLLPRVEAVLDAYRELTEAAEAFHNPAHKLLRIGLSPLIETPFLEQLLGPFRDAHPEVEIFFKQCFLGDMDQRMEQGSVDVALVPRRLARIGRESCPLYHEALYYLPREQGLAPPPPTGPQLLARHRGDPLILTDGCGLADAIGDLYKTEGETLRRYPGQALSYRVVEEWASLGIGAGILPRSKLSPKNRAAHPIRLLAGGEATVHYEAQWLPENVESPHLQAFIRHLREAVPALAEELAA